MSQGLCECKWYELLGKTGVACSGGFQLAKPSPEQLGLNTTITCNMTQSRSMRGDVACHRIAESHCPPLALSHPVGFIPESFVRNSSSSSSHVALLRYQLPSIELTLACEL